MPLAIGNIKQCSSCKEQKDISSFSKNRVTADKLQNACKKCKAEMNRNWKYSLANGTIAQLISQQNNQCKICLTLTNDLVLDHCHSTKRIRGILCRKCNSMLGMVNDQIFVLKNAIMYLGTEE